MTNYIGQTEVKERVVLYGKTQFTYAGGGGLGSGEYTTIAHGLGKRPFVDGQVSKDNSTWFPISTIKGTGEMVSVYTDLTNIYFYVYAGVAGTTYYFRYYAFFVESD